jgi:hypothetical protein
MALVVLLSLGAVSFAADSSQIPSAKAVAKVSNLKLVDWQTTSSAEDTWTDIFAANLKTANQKDLFIDVSLECGLYTKTTVRSKDMLSDTSTSKAGIKVRVLVDNNPAWPSEVTFARRVQELSATLQGQINLALTAVNEEEISLLLDTLDAHSFNFVFDNLTSGVHTIKVQAQIEIAEAAENGVAEAKAMIGRGSVVIEEVRMIKGNDLFEF